MKTARQAAKENFWIGAKGGLIDEKHRKAMGDAVWLFLYLLRGQTGVNEWGEGVFQYGHPVTLRDIASDFNGTSERTIQRWIIRLRKTEYIHTESHSEKGMTFWIAKGKRKTKSTKVTTEVRKNSATSVHNVHATPYANRVPSQSESIREPRTESAHSIRDSVKLSPQTIENAADAVPISKGFIPKNLLYHNKDAAAKTAAGEFVSIREVARKMQVPRGTSEKTLDARRRELLLQAEELKKRFPTSKQPGQAVIERKEAIS